MATKSHPDEIRRWVHQAFSQCLARSVTAADIQETLLVQDGRCRARTYRLGGLMAMWMIDVGLVQCYSADGQMLQTLDLVADPQPQSQRAAA
jgi:hypothetical protein